METNEEGEEGKKDKEETEKEKTESSVEDDTKKHGFLILSREDSTMVNIHSLYLAFPVWGWGRGFDLLECE